MGMNTWATVAALLSHLSLTDVTGKSSKEETHKSNDLHFQQLPLFV